MIINKFNIDKWLFDYFEGNLSPHEEVEVELFLSQNPEFEVDFDTWQDSLNTDIDIPYYEAPKSLYKKEFASGYLLVASLLLLLFGSGIYFVRDSEWNNTKLAVATTQEFKQNERKEVTYVRKNIEDSSVQLGTKEQKIITLKNNSFYGVNKVNNTKQIKQSIHTNSLKAKLSVLSSLSTLSKPLTNEDKRFSSSGGKNNSFKSRSTERNSLREDKKKHPHKELAFFDAKRTFGKIDYPTENNEIVPFVFNRNSDLRQNNKFSYLEFERKKRTVKRNRTKELKNKRGSIKNREKSDKIESDEREGSEIDWDVYTIHLTSKKRNNKRNTLRSKITRLMHQELALHNTHDPVFILNNNNPLNVNFALAGGLEMHRIKSNYLNRWSNSRNPFTSTMVTYDTYLEKMNAGIGLISSYNQFVTSNTNWLKIGAIYSQRIDLGAERSLSIAMKYEYEQVDAKTPTSNVENKTEITQGVLMSSLLFSQIKDSYSRNQLSSAFWYDGKFFYGGLSINKIFTGKNLNNNAKQFAEYINPVKFAIQLGTDYRRSPFSPLVVSPQINFISYGNGGVLWLGTTVKYRSLIAGMGGTFSDGYKINVGTQGKRLRLIYGFSYAKSFAENRFYGTHEVSLRYLIRSGNWKKK